MLLERNVLLALLCCVIASCSGDATSPESAAPSPAISDTRPNPVLAGAKEAELIVEGSRFQPSAVVLWGGEPRPTTHDGEGELRAQLHDGDVAYDDELGRGVTVTVRNPSGAESLPRTVSVAALGVVRVSAAAPSLGALQGLDVRLSPVEGPGPVRIQATDPTGRITFAGLPAGLYALRPVPPEGSALSFTKGEGTVRIEQETAESDVAFEGRVETTAEVRGVVTDADSGEPLREAAVIIETRLLWDPLSTERPWVDSTSTDSDGRYALRSPPGNARITVHPRSPSRVGKAAHNLMLDPGERATADLRVGDQMAEVRGIVSFEDSGEAVDDAAVVIRTQVIPDSISVEQLWIDSTSTDSDGGFSLRSPPGDASIFVRPRDVLISARPEERRVRLPPGEVIELDVSMRSCFAGTIAYGETVYGELQEEDGCHRDWDRGASTAGAYEVWSFEGEAGEFVAVHSEGDNSAILLTRGDSILDWDRAPWGVSPERRVASSLPRSGTYHVVRTLDFPPGPTSYFISLSRTDRWIAIAAGALHTCGLDSEGGAWCWGDNSSGQLGDGSTSSSATPVPVGGGRAFESIDAGGYRTCAITAGGDAYCWGDNSRGQLGDGTTRSSATPVQVVLSAPVQQISASLSGEHTCALAHDGAAWCWGANDSGQLGDRSNNDRAKPVPVSGGHRFTSVSAGGAHSCAVSDSKVPWCWGANEQGELGVGTVEASETPVRVSGDFEVDEIVAGARHSCALEVDGEDHYPTARCWGGAYGPDPVTHEQWMSYSGADALSLTAARDRSCALVDHQESPLRARCWGGTATDSRNWVEFGSLTVGGSESGYHTCGVALSGVAYCWGQNASGQLGNGAHEGSPNARPVAPRP